MTGERQMTPQDEQQTEPETDETPEVSDDCLRNGCSRHRCYCEGEFLEDER